MPFIFLAQNFTVAQKWQEFCHVLQHTGNHSVMPPSGIGHQENKANNFMYHACIPTFMLNRLEIYSGNVITVLHIQHLFNVEYDFAEKRLEQYISNKYNMLNWYKTTHDHVSLYE
ncbi:ImmA/IrrE family metallo-endopeptidase [Lysinibacillus sp. NPDC048646]|uniref:ImmA/IrrE family metallo-endopeptidase n=1 Tax=Lysinibacillus sp. NPDC048646 TaxID=3390574 RepID=UPI003D017ABB